MPFTDAEFNQALAEWQEFGPRRGIPVEQRWLELFPHASADDFTDASRRCREIESYAVDLADQVRINPTKEPEAFSKLSHRYPLPTADRLSHTWSQAQYFASK